MLNRIVCSGAGGLQQFAGAFARAAVLKDGAARHEDLGAGADYVRDCVVMNAAVDFNAKIQSARLANLREQLNLFYRRRNEGLAAKTGIHAHHKNMMNQRKNFVEGVDWSGGVYYYAGFAS